MADDLLNEFINESREHLATIEADLLTIEEGGADLDEQLVNKVFRAAHSIKGGSSFFGLVKVKELAHCAETILEMVRSGKLTPNAEVTNVLLAAFDKLREMINSPAESDRADISDLVVGLTGLASSNLPPDQKDSLTHQVTLPVGGDAPPVTLPQVDVDRARRAGQCVYCVDYDLIHDIERKGLNILHVFREMTEWGEIIECMMDFDSMGTLDDPLSNKLPLRLVFAATVAPEIMTELLTVPAERIKLLYDPHQAQPDSSPAPVEAKSQATPATQTANEPAVPIPAPEAAAPMVAPRNKPPTTEASVPTTGTVAREDTLRVNVGLLESLMNLAGELVLSRNQLRAAVAQNQVEALQVADQRLNQVTSELQDAIMRTRLQPIGNLFGKFPRVVRDMSNTLQKEITLDIHGKDVALDRSLIEGLSDPLTHMIRNAVDHGIETPDERRRVGKKSCGTIRLEARHEAGQVVVEISDDGKGINPARVAESAIAKGLVSAERVRGMSEHEKQMLIFLPGLSTAKAVTDLSGRGVGMDVVKTNLDRLGGQVEIKSAVGKGSAFSIKLPLTLAIIPSLIVSVKGERFAIPQVNVEELLRVRAEELDKRIEVIGDVEVLLLRDQIIPLVRLDALLSGVAAAGAGKAAGTRGGLEIAVVTTGSLQYGLVVGGFHDTEEIVVKPLGRHLKGLREYAGATILGDGTVVLILDIAGLAVKADLNSKTEAAHKAALSDEAERTRLEDAHAMLLFHNASDEVCAVPLDTVLRIERIKPEQVETMGGRRTLQYRGGSLPLVTLSDGAQVKPLGETRDLAVIVSSVRGREVGLLGAMPVDVVETKTNIDHTTHRQKGIAGSAIIRERTTLVADVFELVTALYPEWAQGDEPAQAGKTAAAAPPRVLLAEDSDFFRAQVKKYLEQDGFEVIDARDGQAAWELLEENADRVTIVVTDVEMPRLTGLELAQRIRADGRFARLPIIALSSLAGEEDIAKGKAAGVDEYQVKLDRERLVACVRNLQSAPAANPVAGN